MASGSICWDLPLLESMGKLMRPFRTACLLLLATGVVACTQTGQRNDPPGIEPYSIAFGSLDGYITADGAVAIQPKFAFAGDFSEGLAPVITTEGEWGVVNVRGILMRIKDVTKVLEFHSGLAGARDKDGKFGYIDKSLRFVISPKFDWGSDFVGDRAVAEMPWSSENRAESFVVIDRKGDLVTNARFEWAAAFSEGFAVVEKGGKWGYIDTQGALVVTPSFDGVGDFADGLAPVQVGIGASAKWGFIDQSGQFAIAPKFIDVDSFSEGLAAANLDGLFGLIDKAGAWKFPPTYSYLRSPRESIMLFRENGKAGFVKLDGTIVHKATFDAAKDFNRGLAKVAAFQTNDGNTIEVGGYLRKDGTEMWGVDIFATHTK
jgi:hypothetical protein